MKSQTLVILLLIASTTSFFAKAAEEESIPTEDPTIAEEAKAAENVAAPNDTATLERHFPDVENKRSAALLQHMTLLKREDEVINLSNALEEFYGLYLPQASGQPQGAILILHDEQQHGHWPEVVGPLREYLPLFGWDTLTIELPHKLKRQRIARENVAAAKTLDAQNNDEQAATGLASENGDAEDTTQESENQEMENQEKKDSDGPADIAAEDLKGENTTTDNDDNEPALPRLDKLPDLPMAEADTEVAEQESIIDLIADYQSQNRERINTAIEYLHQKKKFNLIIIGFGQGGSWAIDYVYRQTQQDQDPKGLTLITIDALPNPYDEDLINQQLTDISLPYLDLIQHTKYALDRSTKTRLAIMRRSNNNRYQQIVTQEITSYTELENPTNRRIRGWIKKNAGGMQVPVKDKP